MNDYCDIKSLGGDLRVRFKKHTEKLSGLAARVVQHEYDHIEGKLFTDRISPFKRKLIAGKLNDISKGKFNAEYKTKVYNK